ncbi:MAG: alginate export family protein [Pseudomonadales bacterium]|nr:alginate export family protein [Pseudomonadales bacterium]
MSMKSCMGSLRVASTSCQSVALALTAGGALADDLPISQASDYRLPATQFLRCNEDWSILKETPADLLPLPLRYKYIPINAEGDIWVSFGGHSSVRIENWRNFAFAAPAVNTDSFLLQRYVVHADWHVGEHLRLFSEFKHADVSGRELPGGKRPVDKDSTELQQLFFDVNIPLGADNSSLILRAGRQEFSFGNQRLVSPLPWANALRQWDGLAGIYKVQQWEIQGFYSQFVPVEQRGVNSTDHDNQLFGVYATQKLGAQSGMDYYWLGIDRKNRSFNGSQGDEERQSFGVRHWGRLREGRLDYELEATWQTGELGGHDISAAMLAGKLGYSLPEWYAQPRLTLGFDYASGDGSAGGKVGTFNQLFPLGHAYLGYIDIVGRQNIVDVSPGVTFSPLAKATVSVESHFLSRARKADALYDAGGNVVRPGDLRAGRNIGTELDITFNYRLSSRISMLFGYSYLFAGDFLKDTGSAEDIRFFYGQVQLTF